ncbi:hypothetical protein BSL78_20314, partial [Apostichopus japonicus]
ALYDEVHSSYAPSTNKSRVSTSSEDSAYSLVQKPHQPAVAPRRVNSFHSGRGFSNYDEPVHKTQE